MKKQGVGVSTKVKPEVQIITIDQLFLCLKTERITLQATMFQGLTQGQHTIAILEIHLHRRAM
jgi:hypothetical protein